jgi:redox-sensitive bicupin YhaK (pirin superfamily)
MNSRHIARVVDPPPFTAGFIGEGHLATPLVPLGDFARTDPFIMLMDDRVEPLEGPLGAAHPHAGFETVTLLLEGEIRDRDEGTMKAGDVLWMTAGSGVIHNEDVQADGRVWILQLWLTLPKHLRWTNPSFTRVPRSSVPVRREPGVQAHVYAGSSGGAQSTLRTNVPVTLVDVALSPGATLSQELPSSFIGFLYVIDGLIQAGADGTRVRAGQVGWLDGPEREGSSTLEVTAAGSAARFLLYAGEPTGDPVVQHGPFVGNDRTDITRLYADFRAGRFPRMSELRGQTAPAHSGAQTASSLPLGSSK